MTLHTYTALVVDDDSIARRTVGYALSQEHFECAYATDGADALLRLAEEQFDLVVTDLRMPNTNGHALVVKILSRAQAPVIIVHSSVDDPRLTKDLMLKGVDDIVYKPTHYPAFAAKARALVMRRKKTSSPAAKSDTDGVPHSPKVAAAPQATAAAPTTTAPQATTEAAKGSVQMMIREEDGKQPDKAPAVSSLQLAISGVLRISKNVDTTPQELAAAVAHDATLSAEVLKMANTERYARNGPATADVREAVIRLGFTKVTELAQSMADASQDEE